MKHFIITIAREYGSGGRLIAEKLASELNVPFYDKAIITRTAEQCNLSEDVVAQSEQKKTNSFLYSLYMSSIELPISDRIFVAQSQIIKDIALEGSAVIVGRCADYVLRDNPDCIKIFIHAPLKERVKRAVNEYNAEERKIESVILKKDKERSAYYTYFTDLKWGNAQNYDLCINSQLGIDNVVKMIKQLVNQKGEK